MGGFFEHLLSARQSSRWSRWNSGHAGESPVFHGAGTRHLCTSHSLPTISESLTWGDMGHTVWNQNQLSMYQVSIFSQIIRFESWFLFEPTSLLVFLRPSSSIYKIRDEIRYTRKIITKRKAKSIISNKDINYLMVKGQFSKKNKNLKHYSLSNVALKYKNKNWKK